MFAFLLVILKWLAIVAAVLALATWLFIRFHPVFGGEPDARSLARIQASPQLDGQVFRNAEPTPLMSPGNTQPVGVIEWLRNVLTPPAGKVPSEPLPNRPLNLHEQPLKDGQFVWLGHSTVLFRLAGQVMVTDPLLNRASPIPLAGAPFPVRHPVTAADFPAMDVVLLSHDHYDHLDWRAIRDLDPRVGHYVVPLGVRAHLLRWGVADDKITELDWHESTRQGDVDITLAPARHFSGRRFDNRNSTLWGSWVLKMPGFSLFFNGDSGYGRHFAEIGRRYGPFDVALMENGAYNERWAFIHMQPEQSVQAVQDVRARQVVPIHWGKLDLAFHPWKEPIRRFMAEADRKGVDVVTPEIGQVFDFAEPPRSTWWESAR